MIKDMNCEDETTTKNEEETFKITHVKENKLHQRPTYGQTQPPHPFHIHMVLGNRIIYGLIIFSFYIKMSKIDSFYNL